MQLDHRILATVTLASICGLWWATRRMDIHPAVRSLIGSTLGMAGLQVILIFLERHMYFMTIILSFYSANCMTELIMFLYEIHNSIYFVGYSGHFNFIVICSSITGRCTSSWRINTFEPYDLAYSYCS